MEVEYVGLSCSGASKHYARLRGCFFRTRGQQQRKLQSKKQMLFVSRLSPHRAACRGLGVYSPMPRGALRQDVLVARFRRRAGPRRHLQCRKSRRTAIPPLPNGSGSGRLGLWVVAQREIGSERPESSGSD